MGLPEGLVLLMCVMTGAGGEPSSYAAVPFTLGPAPPAFDLRNMVRAHIVRESCVKLDAVAARRVAAFDAGQWEAWRDEVRKRVREGLGDFGYGPTGPALNVRAVSRHERAGYVIENVLFESLPGWDVNASVYLPDATVYPPPWQAIVVPVGHSGKQMDSYQIPAQVFARLGYVAVTFDPPDMAGEKQRGNDHFSDGVRCYLTGQSSNRYFIADAVRCIDYLATRPDVDMRRGVGMTGVSGGGFTTMFATLLDDRIKASGPSCTAVPNALHPVLDAYAPCPETLAFDRFDAYDDTDVLAAAVPTPLLLMAGAQDEVFKGAWSDRIAGDVTRAFNKADHSDRFRYFSDPGGHAYTVAMALEFVKWMDRWVRETSRDLPAWKEADFEMAPADLLKCAPRLDTNMYTMNRDRAIALRSQRSGLAVREAAAKLANAVGPTAVPTARSGGRTLVWFHWIEELLLEPEKDITLPATLLYPAREGWRGGCLLYFDDRGRWTDLRRGGALAGTVGFIDKDNATRRPAVMTVDLRGWGDTRPADAPYDIAGWADRERWVGYVSVAMGDPILGMRIRDGLAALAYLRSRKEIDSSKIVIGGHGMGGVVALHVAAIDGAVAGVFSAEGLAAFEELATAESYSWSHEDFLPNVLVHYDLPELAASLKMPVLMVNPLGPAKQPLDQETAARLSTPRDGLEVRCVSDKNAAEQLVRAFVWRVAGG